MAVMIKGANLATVINTVDAPYLGHQRQSDKGGHRQGISGATGHGSYHILMHHSLVINGNWRKGATDWEYQGSSMHHSSVINGSWRKAATGQELSGVTE
eukprot:scaffold69367_cov90-Cyclotella_meneghiniana.AAC.4